MCKQLHDVLQVNLMCLRCFSRLRSVFSFLRSFLFCGWNRYDASITGSLHVGPDLALAPIFSASFLFTAFVVV